MRASALWLFTMAAGCASIPAPGPSPAGVSVEADIVRYTNEARAQHGLPALRLSPRLVEAARIHARQMAERQRLEHDITGAAYPDLQSRLVAVSYAYSRAAENIAWNTPSAQSVVAGWMSSSGHRANILDGRLTELGAAMARSSKGEPYWIQVFGTPR